MNQHHLALRVGLVSSLLVALALTLGAGPVPTAGAEAPSNGWIRAGHLSPGTPKADVWLTPFAGGRTQVLSSVSFGDFSAYARVPSGLYTVALAEAGSPTSAAPMISQNVRIRPDAALTVVATGTGDGVNTSVLVDDLTPPDTGQARVRLVSASIDPPRIDAQVVDGPTLAQGVRTGGATGYASVAAQTWSIRVAGSAGDADAVVNRVPVEAGGVYTLVAINTGDGSLALRAVRDSASSMSAEGAMPTGGVDTGAGGLAADQTPQSPPGLLPLALVVAAGIATTAFAVRRRRRPAR